LNKGYEKMSEHNPTASPSVLDPERIEFPSEIRELEVRTADNGYLIVRLLWESNLEKVWVEVDDKKNGSAFVIDVPTGEDPYGYYFHPFARAEQRGSLAIRATRASEYEAG
jgi:hypothetical protein